MNSGSVHDFPSSNNINSVYLVHIRLGTSWCRNTSVNAAFAIASIIPQGRSVFRRKQSQTFILVHLLRLNLGKMKKISTTKKKQHAKDHA